MKSGFFDDPNRASLYPTASAEGSYTAAEKKKINENEMNHKANKQMQDMLNRGGEGPVAPWYTPNFPKGCQYNSPGCEMGDLASSSHPSSVHKSILTSSDRWKELNEGEGAKELRFCYSGVKDEDLHALLQAVQERHNASLELLDLSYNDICDSGAQILAAKLANKGVICSLKEVRLYRNKIGELGEVCLKGLGVIRRGLKVVLEEPDYLRMTEQTTPIQTPALSSSGTFASVSAMSDAVKYSMDRARHFVFELKHDVHRSHDIKRILWRRFAEREIHDLKDALRGSNLESSAVHAAQDYMHALDRSQSGSALRSKSWMQKLARVTDTGCKTRFVVSP